jgi:hypothetical protein
MKTMSSVTAVFAFSKQILWPGVYEWGVQWMKKWFELTNQKLFFNIGPCSTQVCKLEDHMEAHSTDLKCQTCQRNFYTKLALNLHIASHQVKSH